MRSETPVTFTRHGNAITLPGMEYRGLLLTGPCDLRDEPPAIIPGATGYWQVWHIASGMTAARIWGRRRTALARFRRLAESCDWERPGPETRADPACLDAMLALRHMEPTA